MDNNTNALSRFKRFVFPALALVGYQLTICLPFTICSIFIGRLGDPVTFATYGLTTTVINLTFNGLIMGVQEITGVITARLFGAGKIDRISDSYWKGLSVGLCIALFCTLFNIYSFSILSFMSIQEEVALPCSHLLQHCAFYLFFQGFNEITNNFLSAQQITKPLFYLNIASIFSVWLFATIYIEKLGLGVIGFAFTKLTQEALNTCFYLYLMFTRADPRSYKRPSIRQLFKGYWEYLKTTFYTSFSFYGEFLSFEINTWYAALLHNVHELASWVVIMNYGVMYYFTSIGLANAVRNLVGEKIGQKKIKEAKSDSIYYFYYIGAFGLILAVLQTIFRESITRVWVQTEELVPYIKYNIILYIFNIFPTLSLLAFNTVYRVIGKDEIQFRMNIFVFPIAIAIVSYIFCFVLDMKIVGLNISFSLCKIATIAFLAWYLYVKVEWKHRKLSESFTQSIHNTSQERMLELKEKEEEV